MKMETRDSIRRILRKSQGAITIFEMIPIIALITGILYGIKFGSQFGHVGEWIGGLVGGVFGLLCWILFMLICGWLARKRSLSNKTIEKLRTMLCDPNCKNPNEVILELGIKGEKMEKYLPVILDALVSPLVERRRRGWFTLVTVFPEHAKLITDYHYGDRFEKCQEKVRKLLPIQT
jgi:hypothetical protein